MRFEYSFLVNEGYEEMEDIQLLSATIRPSPRSAHEELQPTQNRWGWVRRARFRAEKKIVWIRWKDTRRTQGVPSSVDSGREVSPRGWLGITACQWPRVWIMRT